MPNDTKEIAKEFIDKILPFSALGAFGGVAFQLNEIRKGTEFKISIFLTTIFLAAWIGPITGSFIPDSVGDIKYSIISISGFLAYKLIDFINKKGLSLLLNRFLGENTSK